MRRRVSRPERVLSEFARVLVPKGRVTLAWWDGFVLLASASWVSLRAYVCPPTAQQATSIVVQYIDGEPARIHENFNRFAVEALRAKAVFARSSCQRSIGSGAPLIFQSGAKDRGEYRQAAGIVAAINLSKLKATRPYVTKSRRTTGLRTPVLSGHWVQQIHLRHYRSRLLA